MRITVVLCYLEDCLSGDYKMPGFWQIVIILVILGGILLLTRTTKRSATKTSAQQRLLTQQPHTANTEESQNKNTRQKRMRWFGITILIIGLITLGYILSFLIDYVIILSVAAGLITLTGITIIIFSMRR